jgi:hypothetical protein
MSSLTLVLSQNDVSIMNVDDPCIVTYVYREYHKSYPAILTPSEVLQS